MTRRLKPKASAMPRVPMLSPARMALPGPPSMSTAVPTTSAANTRELLISIEHAPWLPVGWPTTPASTRSVTMALVAEADRTDR